MLQVKIGRNVVNFGLIIVDMQNGFVSDGGSYDKLGMNIEDYQKTIPKIKELINFCRKENIPIFYTEAIREPNGIDLLINVHNILPRTREERLQNKNIPICVSGTWDAQTIDEIKPTEELYNIKKTGFCISRYRIQNVVKHLDKYIDILWNRYFYLCRDFFKRWI